MKGVDLHPMPRNLAKQMNKLRDAFAFHFKFHESKANTENVILARRTAANDEVCKTMLCVSLRFNPTSFVLSWCLLNPENEKCEATCTLSALSVLYIPFFRLPQDCYQKKMIPYKGNLKRILPFCLLSLNCRISLGNTAPRASVSDILRTITTY